MSIVEGINWDLRTSAADNQWYGLTYGNGLYVATAIDGTQRVATSPDGENWTLRNAADARQWIGVAYGNSTYVAVSNTGNLTNRAMTSPDGINWTLRTTPNDNANTGNTSENQWRNVCFGNGLFVAVGTSAEGKGIMTSPDGITWTRRSEPASLENKALVDVTYSSAVGLFVAVGNNLTNRVMTSPDGITWTARSYPVENAWRSVYYGNGVYVAVAASGTGNRVMTSPDGINWTSQTSAADNEWLRVTYGGTLFVAVSRTGSGNRVMTSPDGITWTTRTTNDNQWYNVVHNGISRFVAVGITGTGNRVMTSDPLQTENPICYIGESKVLVQDKQTFESFEVCVKDISPEKHLVYSMTQKQFVSIKVNCISGSTTKFILIEKDLLGENQPSENFYVTPEHPILVNGIETEAKDIKGSKKIKLNKQPVYSLVTDDREALLINNLPVISWEFSEFMNSYKNRINAIWFDNKETNFQVIHK